LRKKRESSLRFREELKTLVESRDVPGYIDRAMREAHARLPGLDDNSNRLALMIFRIGGLISYSHESRVQRPLGLSHAGFHLMWVVWLTGPIESSLVATLMSASRANISGVSNTLEKEGLLARIPSALDRRSSLLTLTPEGIRRFEQAWLQIGDLGRDMLKDFSEDELESLLSLLGKLAKAASDEVTR
jgi:DNA-binding MarR family transcriptional regulator